MFAWDCVLACYSYACVIHILFSCPICQMRARNSNEIIIIICYVLNGKEEQREENNKILFPSTLFHRTIYALFSFSHSLSLSILYFCPTTCCNHHLLLRKHTHLRHTNGDWMCCWNEKYTRIQIHNHMHACTWMDIWSLVSFPFNALTVQFITTKSNCMYGCVCVCWSLRYCMRVKFLCWYFLYDSTHAQWAYDAYIFVLQTIAYMTVTHSLSNIQSVNDNSMCIMHFYFPQNKFYSFSRTKIPICTAVVLLQSALNIAENVFQTYMLLNGTIAVLAAFCLILLNRSIFIHLAIRILHRFDFFS